MKVKKILIIILSLSMVILTIIPTFAYIEYSEYCKQVPSDLGTIVEASNLNMNAGMLYKYYLRIRILSDVNNSLFIRYNYIDNEENVIQTDVFSLIYYYADTNEIEIKYKDLNSNYTNITYPVFKTQTELGEYYYIPLYFYNVISFNLYSTNTTNIQWNLFTTIPADQQTLINEAYQIGYNNGYNTGYNDGIPAGAGILEDLNFVENIEMLIGKFTGDNYAQYITPIAIVLAILLVYFIFIRFLLSLIKAKGVIKVCDIVTLVACISILVVMYLPMIDFTITQHQLVEQVYSVAADVTP